MRHARRSALQNALHRSRALERPLGTLERWLALGGVASPLLLAAAATAVAALRPDYSHLTHFLSELGATGTPGARWMNFAGIVPAGLLILGTALPVYRGFGPGGLAGLGSLLLLLGGAGLAGAGLSPCDAGCPVEGGSFANGLHIELARGGLLCGSLAPLALSGRALREPRLRRWGLFSLAAALLLFALAFAPVETRLPGARQRAFLAVFYAWLVVTCLRLRTRAYPGLLPSGRAGSIDALD